jgi:hypothetical protein
VNLQRVDDDYPIIPAAFSVPAILPGEDIGGGCFFREKSRPDRSVKALPFLPVHRGGSRNEPYPKKRNEQ